MKDRLPNFFIVGAPKAGTTSLYYYLRRHPEVFMSAIKEPNYFSYDETIRQNLYHKEKGVGDLAGYKKLFAEANGQYKAVGEASVSYLFYPSVPGRIRQMVPEAKIIMSLRNPVERAFSHYFMEHKLGYVNATLEDIVLKKTTHKYAHLWYQQYVELGLYYEQVKRYMEVFPKEQLCIFIYDELSENMHDSILRVFEFLGIDTSYMPELEGRYNTYSTPRNKLFHLLYSQKRLRTAARSLVPQKSIEAIKNIFLTRDKGGEKKQEVIEELRRIYLPDIQRLENLLHKNLSKWYE